MPEDTTRDRLYAAYSSSHAGVSDGAGERLVFRSQIAPHLPPDRAAKIVDLGCGQGHLVKEMIAAGYTDARGIDVSPEQVALAHQAGVAAVVQGDYRHGLIGGPFDAVTATDFFEHLTTEEGLDAADRVLDALKPSGVLVMRVPNLASPFGGRYRYGDLTHETSYTAQSLEQLGRASGFADVAVYPCSPLVHGAKSAARAVVWKAASGLMKLALAAETGQIRGHLVTQNVVAVMRKAPSV